MADMEIFSDDIININLYKFSFNKIRGSGCTAAVEFAFEKLTLTTSSISHSAVFKTISLH